MSTEHDDGCCSIFAGNLGNDRALHEGVREEGDGGSACRIASRDLGEGDSMHVSSHQKLARTCWTVSLIQTEAAAPVVDR